MYYENITGKSVSDFSPKTLSEIVEFIYAITLGSERDLIIDYQDFIEQVIDPNPNIIQEFFEWIETQTSLITKLSPKVEMAEKQMKAVEKGKSKKSKN